MLTLKQIEFCKYISEGHNATEAYKLAFKSNSEGTCSVNGFKLLKKPLIQERITELKEMMSRVAESSIQSASDYDIATKAERMQLLTKIMRGEAKINEEVVCDGQVTVVQVEPTFNDRKNAIVELNKMCGDYAPTKTDLTIKQEQPLFPDV